VFELCARQQVPCWYLTDVGRQLEFWQDLGFVDKRIAPADLLDLSFIDQHIK
jgi:hypothetical protein